MIRDDDNDVNGEGVGGSRSKSINQMLFLKEHKMSLDWSWDQVMQKTTGKTLQRMGIGCTTILGWG